jgi:hypothetical protein
MYKSVISCIYKINDYMIKQMKYPHASSQGIATLHPTNPAKKGSQAIHTTRNS